ncbi:hypothetical protein [Paludisphaera rhizosphaerae]|uniref:hypothetical protein n=1 Tax=Paludisphaera rhizosphaerae TaxID=2711216 RepID=UPI0013EAC432|nr:hypothetical protein [Paludisphaera rhizosphaerae]
MTLFRMCSTAVATIALLVGGCSFDSGEGASVAPPPADQKSETHAFKSKKLRAATTSDAATNSGVQIKGE